MARILSADEVVAIAMVRTGYGDRYDDLGRVLHFTTELTTLAGAQAAVTVIGQYDGFEPERVRNALADLHGAIAGPEVGRHIGFSIGRAGSPCIYVNKLSERDVELVSKALDEAGADEVDEVEGGAGCSYGRTIRAWWD
jgi:hypothetical protein